MAADTARAFIASQLAANANQSANALLRQARETGVSIRAQDFKALVKAEKQSLGLPAKGRNELQRLQAIPNKYKREAQRAKIEALKAGTSERGDSGYNIEQEKRKTSPKKPRLSDRFEDIDEWEEMTEAVLEETIGGFRIEDLSNIFSFEDLVEALNDPEQAQVFLDILDESDELRDKLDEIINERERRDDEE